MLLANDPGLGKTATAIELIKETDDNCLILCRKNGLGVWESELAKWYPDARVTILTGTPLQRSGLRSFYDRYGGILLTNHDKLDEIANWRRHWNSVIVDEAHAYVNRRIARYKLLAAIRSTYLLLITASPIVNGFGDLWSYYHLIDPKKFSSYWQFIERYCYVSHNGFGTEITGLKDKEALKTLNQQYVIKRRKSDHLDEIPPKTRQAIPIELTPYQRSVYDKLAHTLVAELENGNLVMTPSVLASFTRLRQLLVTPELLGDSNQSSSMLQALEEYAGDDLAAGQNIAVFTPFVGAFSYIHSCLVKAGFTYIYHVHGGLTAVEITKSIDGFQTAPSKAAIIISIRSGTSFTATNANIGYFVGYDVTPAHNLQAEDRIHRIGQVKPVVIRYFQNKGTVDDRIMQILDGKTKWANVITGSKE